MGVFREIRSRNELADFLGIYRNKLTYVLYIKKVESFYNTFEIPKKNGGMRQINAPSGDLKFIQRRIAEALWAYQQSLNSERQIKPNLSHAFEKKKSIITNAQVHRNKYLVLNLDLESFFESFHFGRVLGYFQKNRDFQLPYEVAVALAQLTCYQGHLPQGAPSSPIITNLICQILDMRILKIAKKYRLDYTRYADDLTFSTNDRSFYEHSKAFLEEVEREINRAGFTINHEKTRLQLRNSRQVVTGLVVNKKVNTISDYYRSTRAMAYHLYKTGTFEIEGQIGSIQELEGRFSFIDQLDHYNNRLDEKRHTFRSLNGREKQYATFLFYKYFYANDRPLIVTEGKTDILYIKSALKKLYRKYPDLIEKRSDGTFRYKVSFFRRSKRLEYFLGISLDGAETMKNVYNYYNSKNDKEYRNYHKWFCRMGCATPKHPVILLYDNELSSKEKPISNMVKYAGISTEGKDFLQKNLYLKLVNNSNLYMATNPLAEGMGESEIEYLFTKETLEHRIEGRSLSLSDKYDKNKYYGKNEFSQYVFQNYTTVDFSGFRGLLDVLREIIKEYK